jgi:hypothetical protein
MEWGKAPLLGVCHPRQRLDCIREAGLGWVRLDVPFPWRGRMGQSRAEYQSFRERLQAIGAAGLRVMGIAPYPRGWELPEAGAPGSAAFLEVYRQACTFLAADLRPWVGAWQVANEMNLELFRQPLTEPQALDYLRAGAVGLRAGNQDALVGVNMAGFGPAALRMYEQLYLSPRSGGEGTAGRRDAAAELDYVGTDGYFGSWEAGGPDAWPAQIERLATLTARPVIIQEYGYSSAGAVMTAAERAAGSDPHRLKKWAHGWAPAGARPAHTPEMQALYASQCLERFAADPRVRGIFWYCWSDHERCWQCGASDCPCETAWGLVTTDEREKPAYAAYREAVRRLF